MTAIFHSTSSSLEQDPLDYPLLAPLPKAALKWESWMTRHGLGAKSGVAIKLALMFR
jgi:hypothetical protein